MSTLRPSFSPHPRLAPARVRWSSPQAVGLAAWLPLAPSAGVRRVIDPCRGRFAGVSGAAAWTHDVVGGWGLRLGDTSNDMVHGGDEDLGLTDDFSLAAWIRTPASWVGVPLYPQIVARVPSTTVHGVCLDIPGAYGRCPRVLFRVVGRAWGSDEAVGAAPLPTNALVHLCGVRRGTIAEIYVNGVLSGSASCAAGALDHGPGPTPAAIGNIPPGFVTGQFVGIVFEARIYRRALTPRLVAAMVDPATRWDLYAPPKPRRVAHLATTTAVTATWNAGAHATIDVGVACVIAGQWLSSAAGVVRAQAVVPMGTVGRLELRVSAPQGASVDDGDALAHWPAAQAAIALPAEARPADGQRLTLSVRHIGGGNRWCGQAAVLRLAGVGAGAAPALIPPVWPQREGWRVRRDGMRLHACAIWDQPIRAAAIAAAWLRAETDAGAIADLVEIVPAAFARALEVNVPWPATRSRYRWRWIGVSGEQAMSPWSAWVDPAAPADLTLNLQELP